MKIHYKSNYNNNFKGKIPILKTNIDIKNVKDFFEKGADEILKRVTERVQANPRAAKYLINGEIPTKPSAYENFLESLVDIIQMPKTISANIAQVLHKKFPDSKLFTQYYRARHVQNHIEESILKNDIAVLRGLYQNGQALSDSIHKIKPDLDEEEKLLKDSNTTAGKILKSLNLTMDFKSSKYDTKYERFITRLVSGFTAAAFLGKDFFNKAKMNGKNDKQANKAKNEKVSQEVIANIGEAISQFAFIATFPILANTNKNVTPVVSAGMGFLFNIISRLIVGRPLHRIKAPPQSLSKEIKNTPITIEDFQTKLKDKDKDKAKNSNKTGKKPLLSVKNILLFSAASIAAGFAIRYGKIKLVNTDMYKSMVKVFKNSRIGKKILDIKVSEIEDIEISRKEAREMLDVLDSAGFKDLRTIIGNRLSVAFEKGGARTASIGTRYKTVKLFGRVELQLYKIHDLILAPFEFIKNVVSFPYQKALQLAESQKWVKKAPKADSPIKDPYQLKNVVIRFREFKHLYNGDKEGLITNFANYIKETGERSMNNITASKIENEKITVTAQVLGMLFGITFNMNDDYNKTVELGGTKQEGEKAARLRGLNKFTRTSIQAVIAGTLNGTLAKQYNTSLLKAGAITATATILTDIACRIITGMPFKQMTKNEQIKYKEEQDKGLSGKYFKFIDRLAG